LGLFGEAKWSGLFCLVVGAIVLLVEYP